MNATRHTRPKRKRRLIVGSTLLLRNLHTHKTHLCCALRRALHFRHQLLQLVVLRRRTETGETRTIQCCRDGACTSVSYGCPALLEMTAATRISFAASRSHQPGLFSHAGVQNKSGQLPQKFVRAQASKRAQASNSRPTRERNRLILLHSKKQKGMHRRTTMEKNRTRQTPVWPFSRVTPDWCARLHAYRCT